MNIWRRFQLRYDVFDPSGQCAGNLKWREALNYADGRRSLLLYRGRPADITIKRSKRDSRLPEVR